MVAQISCLRERGEQGDCKDGKHFHIHDAATLPDTSWDRKKETPKTKMGGENEERKNEEKRKNGKNRTKTPFLF